MLIALHDTTMPWPSHVAIPPDALGATEHGALVAGFSSAQHRGLRRTAGARVAPPRTVSTASTPAASRATWLLALAAAAALALWVHGPISQSAHYHAFADARAWGPLPNAANVLSNLPFVLAGGWALWLLSRTRHRGPARDAWRVFAAALIATGAGSSLYHWMPSADTLALDRLPIAWACAALLAGLLAERASPRWGRPTVLAAGLVFATFSVATWWIGEHWGTGGDLRWYAAVQFMPMLLVPAALWLRLAPTHAGAVPGRNWCVVLALYASAKLTEMADQLLMQCLVFVSGHTLKHLLAAAAAAWLLRAVLQPISSDSPR